MEEPDSKPESSAPEADPGTTSDGVGDALRAAVERTLAVTADSATGTRQRAQSLVDDVVRRGQVARDQVTRRGEEASTRLADAISDLRSAESEDVEELRGRLAALEERLAALERRQEDESNPQVKAESDPAAPHGQRDSGI